MKKSIRLALITGACFLGLAFAAPAFSAYNPSLIMEQSSYKLGGATTADVFIAIDPNADPTAKLTIFSPVGYSANLTAAPGTKIGTVVARVKAKALAGALLTLAGDVLVANPADPAIQAAATQCTAHDDAHDDLGPEHEPAGPDGHDPGLRRPGRPARHPAGLPALAGRSARDGRRGLGAQLFAADFTIKNVFTNAGTNGGYEWSGIFTPYTPGTATPNPAGTLEARTLVGPALVADAQAGDGEARLQARRPAEDRRRRPEGRQARPLRAARRPARRRTPSPAGPASASRAAPSCPASGKYSMARPNVKFATFFQTRFENYTTACTGPSPSGLPVPCREERIAAVTSNQLKVLKPKPKKKHK